MEAENVLQAAYLKVLEGKAKFDRRSSFKTWIFGVIRRTAAEEPRRGFLYRLGLTKYGRSAIQTLQKESADETIYRSQIQTLFRKALASLSRRQQEVLQLVFYHDLNLEEAAEIMGVSIGSARKHYDRGKKHLRQCMEESGGLDEGGLGRKKSKGIIS